MQHKSSPRIRLIRLAGTGYFLLLSTINFVSSVVDGAFYWTDLIFFVGCVAGFVFRQKKVLLGFGVLNLFLWGLLTLALSDDFVDYCAGIDQYSKPWEYFGIGYTFLLTGVIMSLLLLIAYFHNTEPLSSTSINDK